MITELQEHRRKPPELPKLDELVVSANGIAAGSAWVQTVLRQTALRNRSDRFQPFYSIRAVANHFHLPTVTVSRIYNRLRSERLLRTVWGSRTLLEPVDSAKTRRSRRVGIAVALFRFLDSPDYRRAILALQREVWNLGVTEHLMFFENNDEEIVRLCKRHRFFDIDTVIWLLPAISNKEVLLRLQDLGIRIICIGDARISGIRDHYRICRSCTMARIVREQFFETAGKRRAGFLDNEPAAEGHCRRNRLRSV